MFHACVCTAATSQKVSGYRVQMLVNSWHQTHLLSCHDASPSDFTSPHLASSVTSHLSRLSYLFRTQEMSPEDMEEALKQGMESQAGEGEGQQIELSMEMDESQQGQQGEGDEG